MNDGKPNHRLKRERELQGWSQAKVAEMVGTNPPTVSRWERGIALPSPYFQEKLCALFSKNAVALGFLEQDIPERENVARNAEESSTFTSPGMLYDPAIPLPLAENRELVGREGLLCDIKKHLFNGKLASLTVLHGLPGVGKTALAISLAHDPDVQAYFRDGVLWAGVGSKPDVQGLLGRWGTLLNVALPSPQQRDSRGTLARAIHEVIGRRSMLIVIDDVWEVEEALAFKVGGAQCAHLLTTRIPSLAIHASADVTFMVPELDERESLRLLARFVPMIISGDPGAAHLLVNAVGGLPLALTLMGKYLRANTSTHQFRRLYTLMSQMHDASRRMHIHEPYSPIHRHPSLTAETPLSLHSIIAMSDQYVNEQAQRALRALAVFPAKPNSFAEEAALAVCQAPVEVLDMLCDACLLESQETRRYFLHQTIADYARMYDTENSPASRRMVEYIAYYSALNTKEFDALELESRNIQAALGYAQINGMENEYVQIVAAIASFLYANRRFTLALKHFPLAYQKASILQEYKSLAIILFYWGIITMEQGMSEQAERYLCEGLRWARHTNDRERISDFLVNLAEMAEQHGDTVQANRYLEERIALAHQLVQREGVFFHSVHQIAQQSAIRIFFSEMQSMIARGYLAEIGDVLVTCPNAEYLSPSIMSLLRGPGGGIYGVPHSVYDLCLIYNRRLFQEAGLDPDRPPVTWEEFRSMAKRLTNPQKGIYGFAETTVSNQGGWHFTNWLYTAGVQALQQNNGYWQATFNASAGTELLEMFKEMRFNDGSFPKRVLLDSTDIYMMLARGQVAMSIGASGTLAELRVDAPKVFSDIGLAPMPQRGGEACLLGGNAYVFPAHLSAENLRVRLNEELYAHFQRDAYEHTLREAAEAGKAIGVPSVPFVTGLLQKQLEELTTQYSNVPLANYRPYMEKKLTLIPEPQIGTMQYYGLIDSIVQTVLMDSRAQPEQLLNTAAELFQQRFLDGRQML